MYEDAFKLIQDVVKMKFVNQICFLKSGKISVKFTDEPKKMQFRDILSVIEIAETKEDNSKK